MKQKFKFWSAFKNFALVFSFLVNLLLVIVILLLLPLVLPFLNEGVKPLVSGLNTSFEEMNQASIKRTIRVDDSVPIDFVLPLNAQTNVTLTQQVPLREIPATFNLTYMTLGNGGVIEGTVSLDLPSGLSMPVNINMDVPVDNEIPVNLAVDVDIPLRETELQQPFNRLQNIFGPLSEQLDKLPDSYEELLQPQ